MVCHAWRRQLKAMKLVDTATAAAAIGVTDRTIQRWVRAGILRNHGGPRRILVDLDTLDTVSRLALMLDLTKCRLQSAINA